MVDKLNIKSFKDVKEANDIIASVELEATKRKKMIDDAMKDLESQKNKISEYNQKLQEYDILCEEYKKLYHKYKNVDKNFKKYLETTKAIYKEIDKLKDTTIEVTKESAFLRNILTTIVNKVGIDIVAKAGNIDEEELKTYLN